jgi:tetratricopeptide (TPR) repeat protein
MSLLLEALRRAEVEAKKNTLTDALVQKPAALPATSPTTAITHRQAMSAAGVMAGSRQRKSASAAQRRKWWPGVLAVAVVCSVAATLLFGKVWMSTFNPLAATAPAAQLTPAPMPITLPIRLAVPLPDVATPDSAPAALLAHAPVALPIPAVKTRRAAAAPSPEVANKLPASRDTSPSLSLTASVAKPDSLMVSAYAAYQAGNPAEASRLYREVLKADATQRDAWLGLAVIAHADKQREPALEAYKRVLRLEPQNATALAGLHSLSSHAGEPQQESQLRELLARSPEEPDLNHALGLFLSGVKRWSEAQPLFFKAHQLAPQEPRFAYNLAVTLDHLRRSSLAVQYYESSLLLAQDRDAGFNESSARSRLAVLQAAAAQRSTP